MRKNHGLILIGLISLLWVSSGEAKTQLVSVKTLAELQLQIDKAVPGSTIVVENGILTTEKPIVISRQGTADMPITITAATIGGVEINGTGGFVIGKTASHIRIKGFKFTHEAGKTKIEAGATFCRITRNVFECTGTGAYLTVYGDDNQVDYNTFQNKFTEGQMIFVQGPGTSAMAQRTWIHHNFFYNFKPTSNNCSSIQVGVSGRSLSPSHTIVEYNLFIQTKGDNENICNKSCDNIYRYNTFGDNVSELSLRHGNRCQVYGNFFLGSEGIRFFGHNHMIFCNYFERCTPAINIGNGDGIIPPDKLTMHDRPDSVYVVFNLLLNNARNVIMQGRNNGLGATNIIFANNIIQGGNEAVKIEGTIRNPVWEGNMIWKTEGVGNVPEKGFIETDPKLKMEKTSGAHLSEDSPAIGKATGSYPFIMFDIDGQTPETKLNIGADQFHHKSQISNHILTAEEVGPFGNPGNIKK